MLAAPAFIGRGTPGGRRSPTAFGPGENGTGNSGHYPTACHSGLTLGPTLNSRCGTGFQRVMAQLATLLRSRHVPGAGPSKAGFRALRMALLLMVGGLLASRVSISAASKDKARDTVDWPTYLGDKARSLYSPLRQIHRKNVSQLQIAWRYDTGDIGEYQANNLIIAGVLYTASPKRNVIALDAETGKELWKWSSGSERPGSGGDASGAWCFGRMQRAAKSACSRRREITCMPWTRKPAYPFVTSVKTDPYISAQDSMWRERRALDSTRRESPIGTC